MATTEHLKNGTGSQATTFSFTFPYIKQADIVVQVYESSAWVTKDVTTHYTFPTATSVQFVTGEVPDSGTNNIKIYRNTDTAGLAATFYPGSAIRSADLNDNFTQNLYVTQEAENDAATAITDSATAVTTADAAVVTADAADAIADTAKDTADDAQRATDRLVATTSDDGSTWTLTGNNTNASTDPKGVGYAVTQAEAAVTTANTASTTANAAAADVADAVLFTTVADKDALEALTPSEDAYYQTSDSTGLANGTWTTDGETYTLSGIPGTYPNTQLDGITTKFNFTYSTKTYAYTTYFANDGDDRYMVGPDGDGSSGQYLQTDGAGVKTWATVDLSVKADLASPTLTGTPAAPTAAVSTNTTQIATTAFVVAEIADEVGTTVQAYDADLTSLSSCQTGGAAALALLTSTEVEVLDGATLSTTELNYVDGVTSAIQTQLDAKGTGNGDALLASDQTWTGAQRGTITALTDAATIAVDFDSSNNFSVTLGDNRTLGQPSNQTVGQSGSIFITQDGTGSRTLAYHADWKWAGGTAPTLTTTAAAVDRIDYIVAAANKIHAVATLAVA